MINAIVVLLGFQLAGVILARISGLPVPGPVLGALMLTVVLLARRGAGDALSRTAHTILSNLSLLFVPAAVGVIEHREIFVTYGFPLVITLVVSTLAAMAVAALVFRAVKGNADG